MTDNSSRDALQIDPSPAEGRAQAAPRQMEPGSSPSPGRLLRRYRTIAGLTQAQLAERCGYSIDYISKIERDQRQLPAMAIDRIANVLGLDLAAQDSLRAARASLEPAAPGPIGRLLPRRAGEGPRVAPVSGLPAELTSFVGREREVASVAGMLTERHVPLVTLVGPGGIGKTRLAMRVVELIHGRFADGATVVWLAPVADPDHVPAAVAAALGVAEAPGVSVSDVVVGFIGRKHVLLVLDNFEHVQASAGFVAHLMAHCPALRILATSRSALRLSVEHRFDVPSLPIPNLDRAEDITAIGQHAAIRLFVERAQAVRFDFRLDRANAGDVSAICEWLDGLPLAIELAAARVRIFPPHALLERLSPRLALRSDTALDRPVRHQTLRGMIDWSFDLLPTLEQQLFIRLSVFAGGCTLGAIEQVCDPGGGANVVDLLTSLLDKSLIRRGGDDEPWFWLLHTIREYASEKLDLGGDANAVRERHAAYCAASLQAMQPLLVGVGQFETLARLDAEIDNMRAALAWFLSQHRLESALAMASTLYLYWDARGRCTEARSWLEDALRASTHVSAAVRANALLALGNVAVAQGDLDRASEALDAALGLFRGLDDQLGVSKALGRLGVIAWRQGAYARALAWQQESLRIATALGDRGERAYALVNLGVVATHQRQHQLAGELLREAVAINRVIGDRNAVLHALLNLGYDRVLQRQLDDATRIFEEVLQAGQRFGLKKHAAYALENLGNIGVLRGEYEQATAKLRDGLMLARELSDQNLLLYVLSDFAKLEAARGQAWRAAALDGAIRTLRSRLGLSMAPAEDEERQFALEQVRNSLGQPGFDRAQTEGSSMSLDEVLALELSD